MTTEEIVARAAAELPPLPGRTCTVTVGLTAEGGFTRCGRPAVTRLPCHPEYAECAGHAPAYALRAALAGGAEPGPLAVGTRVRVVHGGIVKTGTVVRVGRTLAAIEVPVVRTGRTKVIERPIAEVVAR